MPSADRRHVSSVPAPRLAVRAISASRLAAATLAGLVIVSVIVRTWAASKHAGPAYFPDEYLYPELSRSIATTGHAYVRGAPSHFAPLLAPLVTAPGWLLGNVTTGYHAVQAINATFVSLAAVPVFALARTLRLGRPQALAAAAPRSCSPPSFSQPSAPRAAPATTRASSTSGSTSATSSPPSA